MPWKLKAKKGRLREESSSKQKKLIQNRAEKLRDSGWDVRVYRVR
jgi:hypothetical protein